MEIGLYKKKDFGTIQKDRILEMKKWAKFVKRARDEQRDRLNLAIEAANNHYGGFGPGTANTFGKMLDLSEVTWNGVAISTLEKIHLVTQNKPVYQIFYSDGGSCLLSLVTHQLGVVIIRFWLDRFYFGHF